MIQVYIHTKTYYNIQIIKYSKLTENLELSEIVRVNNYCLIKVHVV